MRTACCEISSAASNKVHSSNYCLIFQPVTKKYHIVVLTALVHSSFLAPNFVLPPYLCTLKCNFVNMYMIHHCVHVCVHTHITIGDGQIIMNTCWDSWVVIVLWCICLLHTEEYYCCIVILLVRSDSVFFVQTLWGTTGWWKNWALLVERLLKVSQGYVVTCWSAMGSL